MFTCQDYGCCNYTDNELKILNKKFMDKVEQLEERNTKNIIKIRMLEEMGVDGRLSYQSSYGFASGQIPRRSQGTLLPSSGEPKVSNPWNNVQRKDSI
jgi:hypothetical protein